MKIEKVYIKGIFKGKYRGPLDKNSFSNKLLYDIKFYDFEVDEAITIEPYNKKYLTYDPYLEYKTKKEAKIHFKNNDKAHVFVEDLQDIVINELKLSHVIKNEGKSYGHIEGVIYATYIYELPTPAVQPNQNLNILDPKKPLIESTNLTNAQIISNEEAPKIVEEVIFGNSKSVWTDRFLGIKKSAFRLIGLMLIGLLIISFLGINILSIGLLVIVLIYFLNKVIAPLFGWSSIPNTQIPSMVSSSRGFLRKFFSFLLFALFIVSLILHWNYFAWVLFGLWILQLFSYSSIGVYRTRRIWQVVSSLLILGVFLSLLTYIGNHGGFLPNEDDAVKEDKDNKSTIDTSGRKVIMNYSRVWYDYDKNKFSGNFQSLQNNFKQSRANRLSINNPNGFTEIYDRLWVNDTKLLPSLIHMLDSIKITRKLNRDQFADMTVSFVQYIPYVLVHDESCANLISQTPNNDFIQSYHREGKECLPLIKFGVQAPGEFGYNLKGDCDTRVVLLFTLLDHFGYDAAILVSEAYGHCVLGLNKPGSGIYKGFYGKKYFVWETTSQGFRFGQFPAEVSNMNNWRIALTSKNN